MPLRHNNPDALPRTPLEPLCAVTFGCRIRAAVQYPARQDRRHERLVGDISGLVEGLLPELIEAVGDAENFSVFGHNMGSVVAFESCRRLENEAGATATVLFASDRCAPSATRTGRVHLLGDRELCEQLLRVGGTPAVSLEDPECRELILSIVGNDYRAIETHACTTDAMVKSPIVALVGDRDPDASFADIQAWSSHTSGSFAAQSFPGGHFFIDANSRAVAELIREHSSAALSSQARTTG
ncbi:thioesterase II family protein [Nocardia sp. NPDC101769]|uniref:thioesterase II family protein n=1 Tax=Nocardia sp. NPDC101769 TaxID=3364333 RepID=UPI0037FAFCCD